MDSDGLTIERLSSVELKQSLFDLREFLDEAFDYDFTDEDFAHSMGGTHFAVVHNGRLIAHASVVLRRLSFGGQVFDAGYVEALAVALPWRGRGVGSKLLSELTAFCQENFAVSMLSTGSHGFYERHGWRRMRAESYFYNGTFSVRTSEEDETLMVLSELDEVLSAKKVVCDFRDGDVW
jgi:aminoglycoside 2'-N-acetyltransferase I